MEQNLILHGVDDSIEANDPKSETPMFSFKERVKYSVIEFLKNTMKLDISIEDIWKAHCLGPHKTDKVRPIVTKVSYSAKELIMEHITKLKGLSNPKTKQIYFISEQIPEGVTERKKQLAVRAKNLEMQWSETKRYAKFNSSSEW